jgi:hypothetical protein
MEITIDKNTYKLKDSNTYKPKTAKTQIVLGISNRKGSNKLLRLYHKDYGRSKKWNTFTITREGVIHQHFDPKKHGDYTGYKRGDVLSISIEMENMGFLIKTDGGKYVNWINEECDENDVVKKRWNDFNYWEKFTSEQVKSCTLLCDYLCDVYKIPKNVIEFQHHHKNTSKFKGVVFRANYIDEVDEVVPLFNDNEFCDMFTFEK